MQLDPPDCDRRPYGKRALYFRFLDGAHATLMAQDGGQEEAVPMVTVTHGSELLVWTWNVAAEGFDVEQPPFCHLPLHTTKKAKHPKEFMAAAWDILTTHKRDRTVYAPLVQNRPHEAPHDQERHTYLYNAEASKGMVRDDDWVSLKEEGGCHVWPTEMQDENGSRLGLRSNGVTHLIDGRETVRAKMFRRVKISSTVGERSKIRAADVQNLDDFSLVHMSLLSDGGSASPPPATLPPPPGAMQIPWLMPAANPAPAPTVSESEWRQATKAQYRAMFDELNPFIGCPETAWAKLHDSVIPTEPVHVRATLENLLSQVRSEYEAEVLQSIVEADEWMLAVE